MNFLKEKENQLDKKPTIKSFRKTRLNSASSSCSSQSNKSSKSRKSKKRNISETSSNSSKIFDKFNFSFLIKIFSKGFLHLGYRRLRVNLQNRGEGEE